jgi:hypothetical protein
MAIASSRDTPRAAAVCSARPPAAIHSGEATGPGATALTSTPSAAQASANSRERESWAALVTL